MVINVVYILYIYSENRKRIETPNERNQVRGSFTQKLWLKERLQSRCCEGRHTSEYTLLLYC